MQTKKKLLTSIKVTILFCLYLLTSLTPLQAKEEYLRGLNPLCKKGKYGVIFVDIIYKNGNSKQVITPVLEPVYDTVVLLKTFAQASTYEAPVIFCRMEGKWAPFYYAKSTVFQLSEFEFDSLHYERTNSGLSYMQVYLNGKTKWMNAYYDETAQQAGFYSPTEYFDDYVKESGYLFLKKNGLWGMLHSDKTLDSIPALYQSYRVITRSVPYQTFRSNTIIYFDRPGKKYLITIDSKFNTTGLEIDSIWQLEQPGYITRKIGNNVEEFVMGQWVSKNVRIEDAVGNYSMFSENGLYGIRQAAGVVVPPAYKSKTIMNSGISKEKNFVLLTNDSMIAIFDCQSGKLTNFTAEVKEYQVKKNNIIFKKKDNLWYYFNREGFLDQSGYDRVDMEEHFVALYKDEADLTTVVYIDLIYNTREEMQITEGASIVQRNAKNNFTITRKDGKYGLKTIYANIPPVFDMIESRVFTTPSFVLVLNGETYHAELANITQKDIFAFSMGKDKCGNPKCKGGLLGYTEETKGGEPFHYEKLEVKTWATYKVYVSGNKPVYTIKHPIDCNDPIHKTKRIHLIFTGNVFVEKN